MATVLTEPVRRRMSSRFRIYVPIAVFTLVVAFVGFWANYTVESSPAPSRPLRSSGFTPPSSSAGCCS